MTVLFYKVGKGPEPEASLHTWASSQKPTVFYFAGSGQVNKAGEIDGGNNVESTIARYIKSLVCPVTSVEEEFDIQIVRSGYERKESTPYNLAKDFVNQVIHPIVEASSQEEDPVDYLKREFSKITFVGFSLGIDVIDRIYIRTLDSLANSGFDAADINEITKPLFALSFGMPERQDKYCSEIPHILFTSDKDEYSPYFKPSRPNPRINNEGLTEGDGFERHRAVSHKLDERRLTIVAHYSRNFYRSARFVESSGTEGKIIFEETQSILGHHPYIYVNTSAQLPYKNLVTFQTSPTAHILAETIQNSVRLSCLAEKGIIRDGEAIIERCRKRYLNIDAKDDAASIVKWSERARQTMMTNNR